MVTFMNICPNCGRALNDGEVCTCQSQSEQNENQYSNPQQNYYQPSSEAYYNPNNYNETQNQQSQQGNNYYQSQPQYYAPAENQPANTNYPEGYKIKKKYVAVILGFVLGALGIHNFYLGNNGKAIAQLLLATVGCFIVVGPIIAVVWAIVETVLILTESIDRDSQGYKIQTLEESIAKANKD
jgi:TM2 domain-containing membrane protein YozV